MPKVRVAGPGISLDDFSESADSSKSGFGS
jgi:hypothetical protein